MFTSGFGWLNSIPIVGDFQESCCRPRPRSWKIPPLKITRSLVALGPMSTAKQSFTPPTETAWQAAMLLYP